MKAAALRLFNWLGGGRIARNAMAVARQAWEYGDLATVRSACDTVLLLEPDRSEAHMLVAHLELPGPNYLEVLDQIHASVRPRTYVEVGVATGNSLQLARPATRAIGIDPAPALSAPLGGHVTVLQMTSDEAFKSPRFHSALSGQPVDLAFIDGMHRCDFVLRDFMNLERLCTRDSTLLMHDCYPLNRLTAERERKTVFWSGDTWRVVPTLKKHRPDLRIRTIAAPPTGLAIVRGLDPSSSVLAERYDEIVAEMLALDYGVLDGRKAELLNRCANEWSEISAFLAA